MELQQQINLVLQRLDRIEQLLERLLGRSESKEWYSTAEAARRLKKAEFTVREWARNGRINARKRPSGRGPSGEWMIPHEELIRIRNEGLLPREH